MSTLLSKPYTHLYSEFYKGIGPEGPYYLVRYLFDSWADSDAIPNEMMGLSYRIGSATVRNSPHQHPLSPNLFCQSARVIGNGRPFLNALGFPSYQDGFVVEAYYGASIPQGLLVDPGNLNQIDPSTLILWCTQELDFDTEVVVFPSGRTQWLSDGKKALVPVQQQISLTTMQLTFHRVPYLPTPTIRSLRGKTNNATFLNASAGKVLFRGARTTREATSDGTTTQRLTLVLVERERDWNEELRKPGVWDTIVDDVGNYRYTQADFTPLVQF